MVVCANLLRFILLFILFVTLVNPVMGEMTAEEEEWREIECTDPYNTLAVSVLYNSTYGMKELCKNISPEIIPDLNAAILEFRTLHPVPFQFLDTSPYLDRVKKANQRSIQQKQANLDKKSLKNSCNNSAKQLREIFPEWGRKLDEGIPKLKQQKKENWVRDPKSAHWVDEALLHDGRVIDVSRDVLFHFTGVELSESCRRSPVEYILQAKHPDTGKTIKWSGEWTVNPIMLDFVDGIPYLVVMSAKVFSNIEMYGCPEIPYAFLKYEQQTSKWVPVPRNMAPKVLRMANLSPSYDGGYMKNGKLQTKEFITGRYKVNKYTTGGFFNAEIPHNYDDWDCKYKLSYKNKRFKNDCRPPLPSETEVVLPTPQEVTLEILETKNYNPFRIIAQDEWSSLLSDNNRGEYFEYCKSLFKQANPSEPWLGNRFTKDLTGQKKVPYNKTSKPTGVHRLCEKEYILYYAHLELPNKMVITKFTVSGDMLYRISFNNPEELKGFIGYIHPPSIKSENGYLTFEWWHFRDYNQKWEVKRTLKVRLREPQ